MRYLRNIILMVLAVVALASCIKEQEPDYREQTYGYVQFKLYKEASYEATKADNQLEYLKDVAKIQVVMSFEGNQISQTLVADAANDNAAEFGLRSDKLKLLAGSYKVLTFSLYNKMDEVVYEGTPGEGFTDFEVVAGGLTSHDLLANVVERGKVRFTLVKDMSDFQSNPATKAPVRPYTFDEITTAAAIPFGNFSGSPSNAAIGDACMIFAMSRRAMSRGTVLRLGTSAHISSIMAKRIGVFFSLNSRTFSISPA